MSHNSLLVAIDETTPVGALAGRPCALVAGNFDGVHKGHRAVLQQVTREAHARGLAACVLTFDPHPAAVVGTGAPPLLTTLRRRVELMGTLGIERVYVRRFDAAFAAWPAERFVRDLVVDGLCARVVVVGDNFRFGAKRAGDLALLRKLGTALGFETLVHPVASDARGPFSSTRVREAIAMGDVEEACHILGRSHELSGVVVRGDARGRQIGFPTANIAPVLEMLPPNGVYAVRIDDLDEEGRAVSLGGGVMNIGVRPTVAGAANTVRTIETFVFDFAGDLYGRQLRLRLVVRLRDERKFGSVEALKAQIARDVADARASLRL